MTQRPAGCESCGGHCAQDAAERAAARQAPLLCAACQLEDDADMYCDEALDDASQLQQQQQQHRQQHDLQLQEEQQQLQQQTTAPAMPGRKRVRWSTITVHEFGVALGGSAVSNKGGPSIGLADAPEFTWTTKVGEMAECSEGVHRFSPAQRVRLLQAAGVSDGMIERHAKEASIILGSRRRTFLEDLAEERKEKSLKRNAEQATLERPCAVALRRPRMIPANYV